MKIAFEVSGIQSFPRLPPGCLQHAFLAVLGASSMPFWRSWVPPGDPVGALCLPSGCFWMPSAHFLKLLAPCSIAS